MVANIRPIVDHLRKLGFVIPTKAIVSSFSQAEQGYEYLGKVRETGKDVETEVQVKPLEMSFQFVLNLKFRFEQVSDSQGTAEGMSQLSSESYTIA